MDQGDPPRSSGRIHPARRTRHRHAEGLERRRPWRRGIRLEIGVTHLTSPQVVEPGPDGAVRAARRWAEHATLGDDPIAYYVACVFARIGDRRRASTHSLTSSTVGGPTRPGCATTPTGPTTIPSRRSSPSSTRSTAGQRPAAGTPERAARTIPKCNSAICTSGRRTRGATWRHGAPYPVPKCAGGSATSVLTWPQSISAPPRS